MKRGESGNTVVHVRMRRLGELVWVEAMCAGIHKLGGSWCGWWLGRWNHGCKVLVLDWKGRMDTVMHVRIHRLWELVWVVAMHVDQGSWCWWWLNGCLVSGLCTVSWQIKDSGDVDQAVDGTCKQWPPGPMFMPTQLCLLPRRNGAWNRGVMVNREAQQPLFHV